jgi:hypothetical protein
VFENTNKAVVTDSTTDPVTTKADVSLQDYYTTVLPVTSADTYVRLKTTEDQSFYKDRADTIKDALKSSDFDAAYDYRLYEFLTTNELVKDKIHFSSETVEENIQEYITLLRENKVVGDADNIQDAWQTYILMLRYQNTVREMNKSLVPTTCAFHFSDTYANDFAKGDNPCYVKK